MMPEGPEEYARSVESKIRIKMTVMITLEMMEQLYKIIRMKMKIHFIPSFSF